MAQAGSGSNGAELVEFSLKGGGTYTVSRSDLEDALQLYDDAQEYRGRIIRLVARFEVLILTVFRGQWEGGAGAMALLRKEAAAAAKAWMEKAWKPGGVMQLALERRRALPPVVAAPLLRGRGFSCPRQHLTGRVRRIKPLGR
jgi:hypothetical protein